MHHGMTSGSSLSGFVHAHWAEDWYFGYQCLNGCNPLLLRQTRLLPPNLAVTSDMLRPFLPEGSSLELELQVSVWSPDLQLLVKICCYFSSSTRCCLIRQKGTVYLLDYEVLDGIMANVVNGKQTYLSAPLCLLHLNQQGQLLPIAIQVSPR